MRSAAGIAAFCLVLAGIASAQEAQLQNRKTVLSLTKGDAAYPVLQVGSMRLSPDGNRLLYIRREPAGDKPAGFTGAWPDRVFRLVLRDIPSGKDQALPGAAMTMDDPMVLLVRANPFDREGNRLTVFATANEQGGGVLSGRDDLMSAGVADLASGRMTKVPLTAPIVLPMFAGDGKGLLVVNWFKDETKGQVFVLSDPNAKPRALSVSMVPLAVAPGTDLVAFLSIQKSPQTFGLFVHDVKTDTTVASLTLDPKNSRLDDLGPQWTADGKHLYYYDVEQPAPSPDGPPTNVDRPASRKEFTRVWGVKQKGEVAVLDNLIPVGPGPRGSMVMTDRNGNKTAVHDPARGATFTLEAGPLRPFWAGGGKVLLASAKPDAAGKTEIFLADIVLPAAATTASAPAKDK